MRASTEAISRLLEAVEAASQDELMALGRAVNSMTWTEDTAAGAPVFLAMIRLALAAYVERVNPDASLDEVLAMFEEVNLDG